MFLKGIAREIISVFFVSIYCISLSPISFFNDHIESTTSCCEHHSQVLYCENLFQDLDISCSHESHVLILEERCDAGDCFTTSEKVKERYRNLLLSDLTNSMETLMELKLKYTNEAVNAYKFLKPKNSRVL